METAPPVKPPHIREITLRSVLCAMGVAVVIGASYPYVVLKLGFGPNISVVSAFFGFLALGMFSKSYNRWENNIVQTAGTTAGQIAFLSWLLAAFDMLADDPQSGFTLRLTTMQTFLWFSTAGILGVLLAVPLRKHFIEDEKLPFPDGLAAAETLILLDSKGPQARKSATAMFAALAASAALMLSTKLKLLADDVWHWPLNRFSARTGVGFSYSLLSLGSGMIIGLRISASMLIGATLSWVVLPVALVSGGVLAEDATRNNILLWVMWPAVGLLVSGGLTALVLKWKSLVATLRGLSGSSVRSGDFPMRWVVTGSLLATVALVVVQRQILGTPVWQSLLAIVLSIPLMVVAMRVLGETNWGPISAMTNVMQAIFGALSPGDMHAGVVSSGITGSVAAESEGLMQDYKTGHVVGSTPRKLTYVQLLAVPVGCLALAYSYPLLRDQYGFTGDNALMSPISIRWVGFAKILSTGFSSIPSSALWALAIGGMLGILCTVLEQNKAIKNLVPSPTGVGIGMLIPANAVITIFLGACIDWVWRKKNPSHAEKYSIPVASGLIAGEALVGVILPILVALKVMKLP
jgi:putative OPT family oligopeptide transporter